MLVLAAAMVQDESWPVWIDNPRVDSSAMCRAYQECARPEHRWFGKLTMEFHSNIHDADISTAVPRCCLMAKCSDRSCFRCEIGQGGYKFRWSHPSWVANYELRKAAGAWSALETEEETRKLDQAWQQRQPEHQQKMRDKMDVFERRLAFAGGCLQTLIMNLLLEGQENASR